jgi:hypothetical protein
MSVVWRDRSDWGPAAGWPELPEFLDRRKKRPMPVDDLADDHDAARIEELMS